MDTAAYTKFTAASADITKMLVQGQAEIFDMFADAAKGTPVAPLFDAAAKVQRATLEGIDNVANAINVEPTKASSKKTAKAAEAPIKATAKAMKKVVDAQADMLVGAGAEAVAATTKTKDAVVKVAKAASNGDMAALYDDLTAVTGIGPSTMKKLHAEGIRTISDLASTSSKDLGAVLEKANVRILKYTPADWIADAKNLMKASKAA